MHSLHESDLALPPFVRKATGVLRDELKAFASRGTDPFGKACPSEAIDLESTTERFREQARQLVDTFVQILKHPPKEIGRFVSSFGRNMGLHGDEVHAQPVSLLKPPPPVKAGEAGYIRLNLENDDATENINCALCTTDLIGKRGHRISATEVNVSPCSVQVPPGGSAEIRIEIRVPRGTPPGSYAGLLQVDDDSVEHAVLQLSVCA